MLLEMLWLFLLDLVLCVRSEVTELSECFTVNGRDYRGTVNHAGPEGTSCLYWNQTTQHLYNVQSDPDGELGLGNHNYCRNPDADVQPWCYVSENEDGIYWKYCDIPSCHMPGYLGCFLDFGTPPALSGASGTSSKLTVQACIRYCRTKGYQYAGVEAGYACFCGDPSDVGTLQPASSSQCDQYCFGKPNEICGGDGKLSVYSAWVGACHENLTSFSGVLYSPDFPEEYGPGVSCMWDVLSPGSAAVELQFHIFQIPDPKDVLEVRDGASGTLLLKIQGGQKPPNKVTLPTGHFWFHFQSDQEIGGPGYAITYRGLPNTMTNSTPTQETSKELYLVSTNSTSEHYSTEHTSSSKGLPNTMTNSTPTQETSKELYLVSTNSTSEHYSTEHTSSSKGLPNTMTNSTPTQETSKELYLVSTNSTSEHYSTEHTSSSKGLPNTMTNSTPTQETSKELYLVSTNSTSEHYSTEHTSSSKGLPNTMTNSTPTQETSKELYLVSTNSTSEHYSTEHTSSSKALLFLAAALLALIALCVGIIIWRYPSWSFSNPCTMVQPTTCSMLYRHKKDRMGDLTCVNQSSMKSLI